MRAAALPRSILVLLISASPAAAQTFREAVELVRNTEPTYLGVKASSAASQEKSRQAFAGFLPQVTATANTSSNRRDYQTRDGQIPLAIDSYNSNNSQINVTQALWRSSNWIALRQAETVVSQADYQLAAAEQDLIARLVASWCDAMFARDSVLFYTRQAAATRQQREILKRGAELGTAAAPAFEEARAKHEQALSERVSAEMDFHAKIAALEQLLGPIQSFVPPFLSYEVKIQDLTSQPLEEWLERSERSPHVLAAAQALGAAEDEIRKQRAGHDPTLDLVGSYGRNAQQVGNFPGQSGYETKQGIIGLQLSIPLYAGGGQSAKVGEAIALREKARHEVAAAQRAARLAVKQAWYGAQAATTRHLAAVQAVKASIVALKAASGGIAAGLKTELELLQAQQQLEGARRDQNKARYDMITSLVKLKAAAGRLTEDDVQLLDKMFTDREASPEELVASN